MNTIVFSNQSSVSFIYILVGRYQRSVDSSTDGGRTMAKMKTTPRARIPTSVTAAAKWPSKTKKFLASIDAALNIFDDQVSSIDNRRETAYKTFSKAYREAFADIWPKITNASVKVLLQSVKDAELHELRRMTHLMSSERSQPTLVKEILHCPYTGQHPRILSKPDTRTETTRQGSLCPHINHLCGPGRSPQTLCKCCKRDCRHCRSHFTRAIDSGSCCCSSAHPATSFATRTNITIICPSTTSNDSNNCGR